MRYLVVLIVLAVFFVALFAPLPPAAIAGYIVHDISDTQDDSDRPCLATSPDYGLVVAWEERPFASPSGVWTQYLPVVPPEEGTLVEAQFHGMGESPRVVWTWQGFLLVWLENSQIHYGISSGVFFPEQMRVVETGIPIFDGQIDVHGLTEAGGDAGWIAFTMPSVAGQMVWFLRVRQDDWDEPEPIVDGLQWPVDPQVTAISEDGPPRPRVYYFQSPDVVAYQDEMPGEEGWQPAQYLTGEGYDSEMDAAAYADGSQGVLSLGPPPTCPCNTIHVTLQNAEGEWQPPVTLTLFVEDYDWPMSPNLAFDPDGQARAFWFQLGTDGNLNPHHGYLEYRVRGDDGSWSDEGDFLDQYETPGLGSRVAMTLTDRGQAVFAWTRKDTVDGEPQPRKIVLARPDHVVAVPESVPSREGPQLAAWPNPFNPRLMVEGQVSTGSSASLAIHDLAGRRVAQLPVHPDGTGHFTTTWNGTETKGRPAAAGVYLLRLVDGDGVRIQRVVLAR